MTYSRKSDGVQFPLDVDKAIAVLAYLASKGTDITDFDKYRAGKLIFLADKFHLVRYAKPIVGGEYRALTYGPVPQDALDILQVVTGDKPDQPRWAIEAADELLEFIEVDRSFEEPQFTSKKAAPTDHLSTSEIQALDHVVQAYGRKTFRELKNITHKMAAYERAWKAKAPDKKIAFMRYEDFFVGDTDAIKGAFEEMMENDALKRCFPVS